MKLTSILLSLLAGGLLPLGAADVLEWSEPEIEPRLNGQPAHAVTNRVSARQSEDGAEVGFADPIIGMDLTIKQPLLLGIINANKNQPSRPFRGELRNVKVEIADKSDPSN